MTNSADAKTAPQNAQDRANVQFSHAAEHAQSAQADSAISGGAKPGAPRPNGAGGPIQGGAHGPPPVLTLPYADFTHALIRAHHDAHALAAANRVLADSLREVLRRQQDLAFELAEAALGAPGSGKISTPVAIFDRAAQAVREVGQAIIDAQIEALKRLQAEAQPGSAPFAFPPIAAPQTVKATRPVKPKSGPRARS